jgi:acetoin utilization deacetylase AcuC-like enzyme
LIHSKNHINSIKSTSTVYVPAFLAVKGVLNAVKAVMEGDVQNAFCAVRPPGHHAHNNGLHYDGFNQGEGFCFFNNVAIAARYAQHDKNINNILILDWDYHHGNGTEWSFYEDNRVFYFSTHNLYTYPGTGHPDRFGTGNGYGYNLNEPLSPYAGDQEIISAWENKLLPKLDELKFKPDFVFISAGFDSRENDYLGSFKITDSGYKKLTEIALTITEKHGNGRLVSVLEGGYNPEGTANAVEAHLEVLVKN